MFLNHKNFSVISDLPGHVFGYSQEPARALRVLAQTCATEVVREVVCIPIVLAEHLIAIREYIPDSPGQVEL